MQRPEIRPRLKSHPRPRSRPLLGSCPRVELLERRALLSTTAAAAVAELTPLGPAAAPSLPPGTPATDASVAGRYVFFNHSAFDGNDPTANASDDLAVAPSIVPLLPG